MCLPHTVFHCRVSLLLHDIESESQTSAPNDTIEYIGGGMGVGWGGGGQRVTKKKYWGAS